MIIRSIAALTAACVLLGGCSGRRPEPARPALFQVAVAHGVGPDDVATGFALGPGRVLTVAHVLQGRGVGAHVYLRLPGARSGGRVATVVSLDERDDLAILAIPGLLGPRPTAGTATGDAVILTVRGGGVRALSAHVLRPIVARIRTPDGSRTVTRPALELRADVLPGDSGAPVLSSDGRVAAVVFARSESEPEIVFAVRATVVATLMRHS